MEETILREAGEDYLESILKLENENGDVRSIDVARDLGVSRPSVNKAIGVLKEMGMVTQEPYSPIRLTELGRKHALDVTQRHKTISSFLVNVLGVDPDIGDMEACKMEHVITAETLERLTEFMKNYLKQD